MNHVSKNVDFSLYISPPTLSNTQEILPPSLICIDFSSVSSLIDASACDYGNGFLRPIVGLSQVSGVRLEFTFLNYWVLFYSYSSLKLFLLFRIKVFSPRNDNFDNNKK